MTTTDPILATAPEAMALSATSEPAPPEGIEMEPVPDVPFATPIGTSGPSYEPIKIQPKIAVTILVGPQLPKIAAGVPLGHLAKPANKTGFITWHDTVYDILARLSEPTDGSLVMLIPGSSYPFQMWDMPYEHLKEGASVYVVPNNPNQVGPTATPVASFA